MKHVKWLLMAVLMATMLFGGQPAAQAATAPAKPKISQIEQTGKKAVTVFWKKVSGAKGYVVSYRVKGGSWKNKTTKKTKLQVKKLKRDRTYQFRVRAYKMVSGEKKYGKYSAVKKIEIESLAETFSAAGKGYTVKTGNTTVYWDTSLKNKAGAIFDTDEVTVNWFSGKYANVTYPVSWGRKTGYIARSAILLGTGGENYTSKSKVTTYQRPYGKSYGSIYMNDHVTVFGTKGNYVQVKYPVNGGYKFAFITKSDYEASKGTDSGKVEGGVVLSSEALISAKNKYSLSGNAFEALKSINEKYGDSLKKHTSSPIVFLFEGVGNGDNNDKLSRTNAMCVVVSDGKVSFLSKNCTTIPDNPFRFQDNGKYTPTLVSGIYDYKSWNHLSNKTEGRHQPYASLKVINAKVLRHKSSRTENCDAINVHGRGGNIVNSTSRNSEGCQLIGRAFKSSPKEFSEFIKAVGVVYKNTDVTVKTKWQGKEKRGKIVVDRSFANEYLKKIGYSSTARKKIIN